MKIVIGTRTYLGSDYTHIDIDPTPLWNKEAKTHHPVDIVCDARRIPLPDGCAEHVFSTEAIEHFPWRETGSVIAEWARLVAPGGTMRVEAPDFLLACQQILEWDSLEGDQRMQQIFFAEQLNQYDFHYAGLTHRTLPYYFEEAGLEVYNVQRGNECGWLRVDGRKS